MYDGRNPAWQQGYPLQGGMSNPYMDRLAQYQRPQTMQQLHGGPIRVTGMDGARAYQMAPNDAVPLFDDTRDVFYIKTTDGAGFPTIRAFTFAPLQEQPSQTTEFVTRAEFNELKGMIMDGKQPLREQSASSDAAGK